MMYHNATLVAGSKGRRKFGTAADFGMMSGQGMVSIVAGDKVSFVLSNQDDASDITIRDFSLIVQKV